MSSQQPTSPEFNVEQFALVYGQLKQLARAQRRRGSGDTINTTALVHDLYLLLAGRNECVFTNQRSFYGYAATAMRHLLIDRARQRARVKHGGDLKRLPLDEPDTGLAQFEALISDTARTVELESALERLRLEDARAAETVHLHVFAGLGFARIAELLDVSSRTVERDWRFARAYLREMLDVT